MNRFLKCVLLKFNFIEYIDKVSKKEIDKMINKGDKVIIVGCAEEEKYKGCIFEVLSQPYVVCSSIVVKMKCNETGKYFGGGYDVGFLKKVEVDENE